MKKFFAEFKEFISRGDVMSMAVGIIIGSAFTAIVNSLVKDVITPLIGIIMGGVDFTGIVVKVGNAELAVGFFIQAIINFLLTALALFCIVKGLNGMKKLAEKKKEEAPAEPAAPAPVPEDIALLKEIRDLLKK